ncbi:hypothetical protein RND71_020895 [Anisodus tanguticus]|uniref:Uncharacterized protein n=1 Tax=Anisodus tanguticus TaxID=243964 RepID=A0AAE1RVJ7_9SOLA|nr:hypothetical protein RND71_020895 [Anisodus tanguticus]
MKKKKRNIKLFEPLNSKTENYDYDDDDDGVKRYEMLKAYELGVFEVNPKEKVLGAPLTKSEIRELLKHCIASNRQVNIGSSLSIYGCIQYRKGVASGKVCSIDEERNDAPTLEKNSSLPGVFPMRKLMTEKLQVCAGAVVLTDCIYWLLIYPLFTPNVYKLRFIYAAGCWYAFYQCCYSAWRRDSEFSAVPFLQICIFCALYMHICRIPVARPYVCLKAVALSLPGYFIQICSLTVLDGWCDSSPLLWSLCLGDSNEVLVSKIIQVVE